MIKTKTKNKEKITKARIKKYVSELVYSTLEDHFDDKLKSHLNRYFCLLDNEMKNILTSDAKHKMYLGAAERAFNEFINSDCHRKDKDYLNKLKEIKNGLSYID